jgi:hypothetical protein
MKLHPKVAEAVNKGEVPLLNAYRLCRLPIGAQPEFLHAAKNREPEDFQNPCIPMVIRRSNSMTTARDRMRRDEAIINEREGMLTPCGLSFMTEKSYFEHTRNCRRCQDPLTPALEAFMSSKEWKLGKTLAITGVALMATTVLILGVLFQKYIFGG